MAARRLSSFMEHVIETIPVVAVSLIGVLGTLAAPWLHHKMSRSSSREDALRAAYASWLGCLLNVWDIGERRARQIMSSTGNQCSDEVTRLTRELESRQADLYVEVAAVSMLEWEPNFYSDVSRISMGPDSPIASDYGQHVSDQRKLLGKLLKCLQHRMSWNAPRPFRRRCDFRLCPSWRGGSPVHCRSCGSASVAPKIRVPSPVGSDQAG